ncbi:MAG: DUF2802 domain-containing protein [Rhodanobacter sp.]
MWLEIGVGLVLLLTLLQLALLFPLWRRLHRLEKSVQVLAGSASQSYTDVPTSMLVTVMGRVERRLTQLEQPTRSAVSYELAQQLAREGADVEQLVARCGLSRDEATLVRQLHPVEH